MPSHKKAFPLLAPMIGEDRTATVYQWMIRNGLRHAGIDFRNNGALPMPDEIATYLGTLARRHDVYPTPDDHKRMHDIERQIEDATRFVVDTFSIEYLEERSKRARNGYILGISKARALGTGGVRVSPHLPWLREHPDTGATEAGRALGITRQQVNRLRSKIVALDAQAVRAATDAELERLIPLRPDHGPVAQACAPIPSSLVDDLGSLDGLTVEPPASPSGEDLRTESPPEPSEVTPARSVPSWTDTWSREEARESAEQVAAGSSALADAILEILNADDTHGPVSDGMDLFEEYRRENPLPETHDTGHDLDILFAAMEEQFRAERETDLGRPLYREALEMGLVN
jgi:hypothetical protein